MRAYRWAYRSDEQALVVTVPLPNFNAMVALMGHGEKPDRFESPGMMGEPWGRDQGITSKVVGEEVEIVFPLPSRHVDRASSTPLPIIWNLSHVLESLAFYGWIEDHGDLTSLPLTPEMCESVQTERPLFAVWSIHFAGEDDGRLGMYGLLSRELLEAWPHTYEKDPDGFKKRIIELLEQAHYHMTGQRPGKGTDRFTLQLTPDEHRFTFGIPGYAGGGACCGTPWNLSRDEWEYIGHAQIDMGNLFSSRLFLLALTGMVIFCSEVERFIEDNN